MTLAVSGVFSLGIVAIVHFVEEHLVSQDIGFIELVKLFKIDSLKLVARHMDEIYLHLTILRLSILKSFTSSIKPMLIST